MFCFKHLTIPFHPFDLTTFGTDLCTLTLNHWIQTKLDDLFRVVMSQTHNLLRADRASLFIVDAANQELVSRVAEGVDRIAVPLGQVRPRLNLNLLLHFGSFVSMFVQTLLLAHNPFYF